MYIYTFVENVDNSPFFFFVYLNLYTFTVLILYLLYNSFSES